MKIVVISHYGGAVSTRDVKTGKDLPQPLIDKILDGLPGTAPPEPSPMCRSKVVRIQGDRVLPEEGKDVNYDKNSRARAPEESLGTTYKG